MDVMAKDCSEVQLLAQVPQNSAVDNQRVRTYRVAVVRWFDKDELSEAICSELCALGHSPISFDVDSPLPSDVDVVFSFAPYGKMLHLTQKIERLPLDRRPILIHWNTEGIPDPRIPWGIVRSLASFRSWLGRVNNLGASGLANVPPLSWEKSKMLRFRYVGDYYYSYRKGLLHIFADSSVIYAQIHRQHGLPTMYMPWGAIPRWYADQNLERDIDVLWMGKRGSKRRSNLIDRVRAELRRHGVSIYMADNVENPYIFGEERTRFLNRAKITLNITRTWFDDNFSRFSMAAPNRSLIVSEPLLPHCPEYEAGTHYVAAAADKLTETILFYLQNELERKRIVENAYQLVTTKLTMRNSVERIMQAVQNMRPGSG